MKAVFQFLRFGAPALLLALACVNPASAASCWGNSGNLVFGTINLLAGGVTDSSSTINYGCSAQPGERVLLCFNMEADPVSGLYTLRNLESNNDRMAFNLYTDVSRTTIWGSTKSSTYPPVPLVMAFGAGEYSKTGTTIVYGRVSSAGQTGLPAGTYSRQWPMSISYKVIPGGAPPDCSAGGMGNAPSTFYTSATVTPDCRIDSSTTMDFGTVFQTLSQNVDTTAAITVTCNGGQGSNGYRISLGNGLHANGSQRRMQGPGGYINYEIYQNTQRTSRWGSGYNEQVPGSGTGLPQVLTAYGRVPPQIPPGIGLFTDTVVITLTY